MVGWTGAGKSSLANAICWIFEAESGKILIDDADISTVNQKVLWNSINVITQEPNLFEGTLWFNIDPT